MTFSVSKRMTVLYEGVLSVLDGPLLFAIGLGLNYLSINRPPGRRASWIYGMVWRSQGTAIAAVDDSCLIVMRWQRPRLWKWL